MPRARDGTDRSMRMASSTSEVSPAPEEDVAARGLPPHVRLSLATGPFVLAFLLSLRRMADSDLWAHLKCGEYLFRTGTILTTHYFNCSWRDFPYVNHSWLFQAVIYAVNAASGEAGLMALQVLLILLAFAILYNILRSLSSNRLLVSFVLLLGVLAAAHRVILRPQHFSYVFLLYFLISIHQFRRGNMRPAYFLPAVMLVWANMHAECLWGIMVLSVFLVIEWFRSPKGSAAGKQAWNRLFLIFGLVFAAALVNPFTWKTVFWPAYVMKEQFAGVEEILPPTGLKFVAFWIYFGLVVVSSLLNARRLDPFWLALSVIFAGIAWTANRGIPHFVFVSAPLVVQNLDAWGARQGIASRLPRPVAAGAAYALIAVMLAIILSIVTNPLYLQKYDNYPYPEKALAFLKAEKITGNVINDHAWGGYIIWNSWPGLKPYIDGRFFQKRFYDEYFPLIAGQPGWDRVLEKYAISIAILMYSPTDSVRLNDRLIAHPDWRLVYWDDSSLVYLKMTEQNRRFAELYGRGLFNPDRDLYAEHQGKAHETIRQVTAAAERNLAAAGGSWKASITAANGWFALGEHAKARERYLAAARAQKQVDPWIYYRIALCHRAEGDLAKTEEYVQRCLELVPGSPPAQTLLREVQFLRGSQASDKGSPIRQ